MIYVIQWFKYESLCYHFYKESRNCLQYCFKLEEWNNKQQRESRVDDDRINKIETNEFWD